jgi:RecG-like helicase
VPETLPDFMLEGYRLLPRWEALQKIHFPESQQELDAATRRLKFEELFFLQLRLLQIQTPPQRRQRGLFLTKSATISTAFTAKNCPSNSPAPKNGCSKKSGPTWPPASK